MRFPTWFRKAALVYLDEDKMKDSLLCDVMRDFKEAVRSCTFGVHDSLGNALPVELGELVDEVEILKEDGTFGSSSHRVLVVVDGRAGTGGEGLLLHLIINVSY